MKMGGLTPRRIRTRLPLDQPRETKSRIALEFETNHRRRELLLRLKGITTGEKTAATAAM